MADTTYRRFVKYWEQVTDLPPQTLGPLTPVYKRVTKRLKVMPWPWFVIVSVATVMAAYVAVGSAVTFIVSLLQGGF